MIGRVAGVSAGTRQPSPENDRDERDESVEGRGDEERPVYADSRDEKQLGLRTLLMLTREAANTAYRHLGTQIATTGRQLYDNVGNAWSRGAQVFDNGLQTSRQYLDSAFQGGRQVVGNAMQTGRQYFDNAVQNGRQFVDNVAEGGRNFIGSVASTPAWFNAGGQNARTFVNGAYNWVGTAAQNGRHLAANGANAASNAWSRGWQGAANTWNNGAASVQSGWNSFQNSSLAHNARNFRDTLLYREVDAFGGVPRGNQVVVDAPPRIATPAGPAAPSLHYSRVRVNQ